MKHPLFLYLCLSSILTIHPMEQSLCKINQDKPRAIPTLYALCKHQITQGHGNTYEEQRTNALQSIEKLNEYVDDYCVKVNCME